MGFDGGSLNASKCPEMPSKPTSARRPPEPMKRSRRGHPPTRLDPIPTHISDIRHGSEHRFSSNLTVHRVGRCCRRRVSHREATLFFYYEFEVCPRVHGTICSNANGTLHPDDVSMARALTVPLHPVSRCRPPAAWQLRSWLEA